MTNSSAVRDLGIPVKGVSWVRLHAGQTAEGKPSLLATMSQNNGGLFVIDIDVETGHCTQFSVENQEGSTFSTASFRSLLTGILYVGSAWDGNLHRFDPSHPEKGIEDLGKIADDIIFPTGITETPDGIIWIGGCNGARLTQFDPKTETFTAFGRMSGQEEYLYPLGGDDGSLAALVRVVRPHLIAIDPETGDFREVGPAITDTLDKTQYLRFFKGIDRLLYLDSYCGQFRVEGMLLTPVVHLPEPLAGIHAAGEHRYQAPLTMPGGWQAQFIDDCGGLGSGVPRKVLLSNTDPLVSSRLLHLDWKGGGSNLFSIQLGPDGMLYGSSYLPNQLYRASLDGSVIENLGQHTFASGQAYSIENLDDKVYLASYPQSRLSVYDPKLPIFFGNEEGDNPRDLGRMDEVGYRPNAMIASPDGKLWIGSGPDYGLRGGILAWYDPKTKEKASYRSIVPDTSPSSLLWLPESERLLVGLSIEAGTGTAIEKFDGSFAVWDPKEDRLEWSGDFGIEDLADVTSLAPVGNGLVYALIGRGDSVVMAGAPEIRPRIALIDPNRRELVALDWLPEGFGPLAWHGRNSLRIGPGGSIYGATGYCIFRIKPGTCEVERKWQLDEPELRKGAWHTALSLNVIDTVGPIVGNEFYFATGWRLRSVTLPEE
jgi:streptogramin lyase